METTRYVHHLSSCAFHRVLGGSSPEVPAPSLLLHRHVTSPVHRSVVQLEEGEIDSGRSRDFRICARTYVAAETARE
eukprot:scaffold1142_cov387-Prasinococcus_capsulatus_cf.AAC.13